jgi:hypothetical protein
MKITITRAPGRICPICKQKLKVGEKGANFMVSFTHMERGHIPCVKRWRDRNKRVEGV